MGVVTRFDFATATEILFGAGRVREVGARAVTLGRRALVVTGATATRARPLLELLAAEEVQAVPIAVVGEPTVQAVRTGVAAARQQNCDLVIGCGGGSALDAGKTVAALLTNEGDPLDYLEVIGRGRALTQPSAPYIAIPTTAGTGAEVTRNAVLASPEHRTKVSLRSPFLLPRLAVVDPELTYSLPPEITASTGLDSLAQLIEPFVSLRANPLVDALCREGLSRVARSLRRAYSSGREPEAREDMSLASLFGGLALANAGLGAVHGLAGPLGGMFPAPHGALCGRLLPQVMAANIRALEHRQRDGDGLHRYGEVARILTGDAHASAGDGAAWTARLVEELRVPSLSQYGMTQADIPAAAEKAARASSMKSNPVSLTTDEMQEILAEAL
jgi:alcohol dehydrogenase class IV